MPHPIRPPFPPGKGAFRVPLKPPQCKECDTAPSKSLPCVRGGVRRTADGGVDRRGHDDGIFPPRGGVSRSADGGVVGANHVIKRPGGELYGSCTLQNQCAAARRLQSWPKYLLPAFLHRKALAAGPPQKRRPPPCGRGLACLLWFGNYSLPSLVRQLRQTYLSS